jgi:hypothetical protein
MQCCSVCCQGDIPKRFNSVPFQAGLRLCPAAGVRQRRLQTLLQRAVGAVMSHVHAPDVAVGSITAEDVLLLAHIHGEELPRRFEDVVVVRRAAVQLRVRLWVAWGSILWRH